MNKRNMTKKQIEALEKEKRSKLIEKNKNNTQEKLKARILSAEKFYEAKKNLHLDKTRAFRDKKKNRAINKIKKSYKNKEIDKTTIIKWWIPKQRISTKIKQKAYTEIQKYARLLRANSKGMVKLADTWQRVHRTKAQWWHIYSKKNYPQLAFNILNIRPITSNTNRIQWESTWEWRYNVLDKDDLEILHEVSEDKEKKNTVMWSQYYQDMYELYREKNKEQEKRLWKYYKFTCN